MPPSEPPPVSPPVSPRGRGERPRRAAGGSRHTLPAPLLALLAPLALALALVLAPLPGEAVALERGETRRLDTGAAAALLARLDQTLWVADGRQPERHAYVIAATDDPLSRRLWQISRTAAPDVQLRWILQDGPDAGRIAQSRDRRRMARHMDADPTARIPPERPGAPEPAARRARLNNRLILGHLRGHIGVAGGTALAYPTLIVPISGGAAITVGLPEDLATRLEVARPRPDRARHAPVAARHLESPPRTQPLPDFAYGSPSAPVTVRLFPDARAARLRDLPAGTSLAVTGRVAGTNWLEVAATHGLGPGYVQAPELAPWLAAGWRRDPLPGRARHAARPVALHLLPAAGAPILGQLEPGQGYAALARIETPEGSWLALDGWRHGAPLFAPADAFAPPAPAGSTASSPQTGHSRTGHSRTGHSRTGHPDAGRAAPPDPGASRIPQPGPQPGTRYLPPPRRDVPATRY